MLIRGLCLLLLLFGLSWLCVGSDWRVYASADSAAEQLIGVPQHPFYYVDIDDGSAKIWYVKPQFLLPSDYFTAAAAAGNGMLEIRQYLLDMLDVRSSDHSFFVHSPGQLRL